MKKYLLFFSFSILLAFTICSQNNVNITIEVIAGNLPEGSSIYITGNDDELGDWQPDSIELSETEKAKWSKSFSFIKGKKLEFKFTRGSWQNEALNDDGSTPVNYTVNVSDDTSITYKINLWADQVERKIEGQITGTVRYHRNFQGNGIKPRDIIVWLPPGYDSDLNKNYPVLYMHDGQNIVDPKTSLFQVDWQIDETVDSLIRKGLIEEIIIVGIYNTPDRRSEYSENDTGYAYMNFMIDSLKPFIDRNYMTLPERNFTATGGSSMGGLISFMLTWEHPDIFSAAICMSPAFKVRRFDYVDNVESYKGEKKDIKLYIDNGGVELDSLIQFGVDEMLSVLNNKGYTQGEDFYWFKDEDAQHNEVAWAKRIWRALIFLFGTKNGRSLL